MSMYREIRSILAQLSGHDRIVTIPKTYIELTGDLSESILLNQIVFYSDKSKRTDGYFYKSHKEWTDETCLTERQIRYATKKLKDKGLVETKLLKANGAPTVHYKLCSDKLVNWIMTNCDNGLTQDVLIDSDKVSETLTEITTEITTEINYLKDNVTSVPFHPFEDIINHLNEKAETNFRSSSKKTQTLIKARINEGFTLDDFKLVINNKVVEWLSDGKMNKFLRPETLFGTKFESYLNEKGRTTNAVDRRGVQKSTKEYADGLNF